MALGGALTKSNQPEEFSESWDGTNWTVEHIPDPANAFLLAVSCASFTDCIAVGRDSVTLVPLAEHWDGTSWTAQNPPVPPGNSSGTLAGVSCTTTGKCVAVGYTGSGAFSESWNGTTWTPHLAPRPVDRGAVELVGVSCRSGRSCEAVGLFQTDSGESPLAESWDGRHWTIQAVPVPAGANIVDLLAVSCRFATHCMAVGTFGDGRAFQALAEQWNGTAWTMVNPPHRGGANAIVTLLSVSCPRSASCTAAGDATRSDRTKLLAEHWNGTRWTVEATVVPPRSRRSDLAGVSCPARGTCIAVGDHAFQTGGRGHPLAEQNTP